MASKIMSVGAPDTNYAAQLPALVTQNAPAAPTVAAPEAPGLGSEVAGVAIPAVMAANWARKKLGFVRGAKTVADAAAPLAEAAAPVAEAVAPAAEAAGLGLAGAMGPLALGGTLGAGAALGAQALGGYIGDHMTADPTNTFQRQLASDAARTQQLATNGKYLGAAVSLLPTGAHALGAGIGALWNHVAKPVASQIGEGLGYGGEPAAPAPAQPAAPAPSQPQAPVAGPQAALHPVAAQHLATPREQFLASIDGMSLRQAQALMGIMPRAQPMTQEEQMKAQMLDIYNQQYHDALVAAKTPAEVQAVHAAQTKRLLTAATPNLGVMNPAVGLTQP